jgi:hypothetical protein
MLLTSTTVNGAVSNDSNNNITMSVGNNVIANVNSSGIFFESGKKAIYTGAVLQVVSTTKTDTFSTASGSHVDITGMSVSITPTSSSNKILIVVTIGCIGTDGNAAVALRLLRGSTVIAQPDVGTADARDGFFQFYNNNQTGIGVGASVNFLDSPATTSSTTYKVSAYTNAGTCYVNRLPGDSNWHSTSTITVMEIAA